jgi:hypothetical protein
MQEQSIKDLSTGESYPSGTILLPPMSLLLEPNSADTNGEESQNYENILQSSQWQNIKFDENKMGRVITEIGNDEENLPQIIEAAKAVLEVSNGIKAIIIPLCLFARKTNSLLFSGYRTTKRTSSGL